MPQTETKDRSVSLNPLHLVLLNQHFLILTLDTNQAAKETNEPLVSGGVAMQRNGDWNLLLASRLFPTEKRARRGHSTWWRGEMSVASLQDAEPAPQRLHVHGGKKAGMAAKDEETGSAYTMTGFQSLACSRRPINFLNKTSFQRCTGPVFDISSRSGCLCGSRGFSLS